VSFSGDGDVTFAQLGVLVTQVSLLCFVAVANAGEVAAAASHVMGVAKRRLPALQPTVEAPGMLASKPEVASHGNG